MLIFGIVTRGALVLGEYGPTTEELSQEVLTIILRNVSPGTRLVPMNGRFCAVMNKSINGELISFATVIESNEERDGSFNFLDALASFYEKEAANPKMKTEMNAFISRQLKTLMEKANTFPSPKDKLQRLNDSMQKTTDVAKSSISKPLSCRHYDY
jgi:hypothetical protein